MLTRCLILRSVLATMLVFACASRSHAQQGDPAHNQPFPAIEDDQADNEPVDRLIYAEFNVLFTNAYYFRGYLQEDDGLIVQPDLLIGLTLFDDDAAAFDIYAGLWNSLTTEDDLAGDDTSTDWWYEADFYVGASLAIDTFEFSLTYISQTSPADAFDTIDEIVFEAAYDDSEDGLLFGASLQPSIELAFETYNSQDDVDSGIYLGLSIEPFIDLENGALSGSTLSFPVTVGLSLHDFYQDEDGDDSTFGFLQAGARLLIPLDIDPAYGAWSLTIGGDALYLDGTTQEYNDGDDFEGIAYATLSISF